jgi:protein disulfide-isomerase A1
MLGLKQWVLYGLIAACTSAVEFEEDEGVIVLTDDNFDDVVTAHPQLLVEFYAPWCGHCKSLAPEYVKAAAALKDQDIRIAKVDATEEKKVGEKYGVQGFPTLKFFQGSVDVSDVSDYDGGRTADDIVKWMTKKSGPSVVIVDDQKSIDQFKEDNDVVIVAYIENLEGDEMNMLEKIASLDDNAAYLITSNADLAKANEKIFPSITLFKKFDEGKMEYEGEFTSEEITSFVKENSMPLIMTFSQEKASQIFGGETNLHLLMFVDESKDYYANFEEQAKIAPKENKGKLLHIFIPLTEDRIMEYFGFKEDDLPAIMLVNMESGMKKFAFTSQGEELLTIINNNLGAELIAFEASYFEGTLTRSLKSAEPIDDSDEAVKVIAGKEFQERVIDNKKDVLLEFYAPWCGHCKNLAPKYEELAEKLSGVDSIMIAKIDATENEVDHPKVDVSGFPTILFFPANDKANPVVYGGAREVGGMLDYLKENASKFDLEGEGHGVAHEEL